MDSSHDVPRPHIPLEEVKMGFFKATEKDDMKKSISDIVCQISKDVSEKTYTVEEVKELSTAIFCLVSAYNNLE